MSEVLNRERLEGRFRGTNADERVEGVRCITIRL
jgi:hypothetical protein